MTLDSSQRQRLEFLCRVTQKEVTHLLDTDRRLFADLLHIEDLGLLTSAFQTGHAHVPQLVHAAQQMVMQAQKILAKT